MSEAASSSQRRSPAMAYRQAATGPGGAREQDVLRHLPLVQTVVDRVAAHLPPHVDRDDLFHAGVIGLIDALVKFDPSRDNAFSTYAVLRIRGAVIDELRARDWVPRGARERAKAYQLAVSELSQQLGRLPRDDELANRLGIDLALLPELESQSTLASQVSIDTSIGDGAIGDGLSCRDDETSDPGRHMEADDRRRMLTKMLATLTEQERLVVKLYYFENLMMKEIAAILGVTESRICQIHSRVMGVLKARFGSALVL